MKIRGFTIIEMTVVMVVVGILASISVPKTNKIMQKSKQAEAINMLTKMYRGYKTAIIDGVLVDEANSYMLYNYTLYGNPSTQSLCFNPDESNQSPNDPSDRSVGSWAALGFEQNPNYETTGLYFSYDFLKPTAGWAPDDYASTGSSPRSNAMRPSSAGGTQNIGVAWLKVNRDNTQDGDEFYDIYDEPDGKWIFIDMHTGKIFKGSYYQ
ncbi:type IV pilin protein [Candidatus Omnitrophota bacterium]